MAFKTLSLQPFIGHRINHIVWEFAPVTPGLDEDATITFERSEFENGPYEEAGTVAALAYNFVDQTETPRSARHNYYYRAILRRSGHPALLSRRFSNMRFKTGLDQSIFERVLLQQSKELRLGAGIKVWLYRRITDGPPCTYCRDQHSGQSIAQSICTHCWGTGVAGGYAAPVAIYVMNMQPRDRKEVRAEDNISVVTADRVLAAPGLPRIYSGDVLVIPDLDERLRVGNDLKHGSYIGLHPIDHRFITHLLPADDLVRRMPVPSIQPTIP